MNTESIRSIIIAVDYEKIEEERALYTAALDRHEQRLIDDPAYVPTREMLEHARARAYWDAMATPPEESDAAWEKVKRLSVYTPFTE